MDSAKKQRQRLRDGLVGGFVSGYHNLSQDGECFIFDNAVISGEMRLIGSARAYGKDFLKRLTFISNYSSDLSLQQL